MKTTFYAIGGVILAVVLVFALMIFGFGVDMFGLTLNKHVENKKTEVTRETNQFVTSAQQQLATLAKEYRAAESDENSAQQKLIAEQMDQIASTLDAEYVKPSVAQILNQEGYDY
jgi:hypothetical protein